MSVYTRGLNIYRNWKGPGTSPPEIVGLVTGCVQAATLFLCPLLFLTIPEPRVCVCVCVCVCVHGGYKKVLDSLELELQMVISHSVCGCRESRCGPLSHFSSTTGSSFKVLYVARMTLNSWSLCLYLPSTKTTGMHQAWLRGRCWLIWLPRAQVMAFPVLTHLSVACFYFGDRSV